jgi:hypothetical protein
MRYGLLAVMTSLLAGGGIAQGDPISYEQIPSGVGSYAHVDVDQLLASRIVHGPGFPSLEDQIKSSFGGDLAAFTMYAYGGDDADKAAILVRARGFDIGKWWEPKLSAAKNAVTFNYQGHTVHHSSQGLEALVDRSAEAPADKVAGAPTGKAENHGEAVATKQEPVRRNTFSLGLGIGKINDPFRGPVYVAFVGQDLLVASGDIRGMADALDVLDGRRPSLAKEDPKGLKIDAPKGAIFVGAGLTANLQGNTDEKNKEKTAADSSRQPLAHDARSGFGFDFLGSFSGKATLGRLEGGEDAQSEYIHASLTMVDPASAEQLKNMILGLKAMVSFSSNSAQKALIVPLNVRAAGKDVMLDWSWSVGKMDELYRLMRDDASGGRSSPTSRPSTLPSP